MAKEKKPQRIKFYNGSVQFLNMANSYLDLADIGLKSFINTKKSLRKPVLLIPIIYSVKHGVELYLKALGVQINMGFWKTHNKETLYNDIERQIEYLVAYKEEMKERFRKFANIVFDYHFNKIGGQQFFDGEEDCQNDFFRFPQNKSQCFINLKDVDIGNLRKDIQSIRKLGEMLDFYIQLNKRKFDTVIFLDNPGHFSAGDIYRYTRNK